jgi:hypothetical protein
MFAGRVAANCVILADGEVVHHPVMRATQNYGENLPKLCPRQRDQRGTQAKISAKETTGCLFS